MLSCTLASVPVLPACINLGRHKASSKQAVPLVPCFLRTWKLDFVDYFQALGLHLDLSRSLPISRQKERINEAQFGFYTMHPRIVTPAMT